MSLYTKYNRTIHAHTGYRATWFPFVEMKVGDVGVIEADGTFTRHTDLAGLGIPHEILAGSPGDGAFSFKSDGVKSVTFKAAGESDEAFKNVAEAKAGIKVEFSGKNSVILETKGARADRIGDVAALDRALLDLVRPGPDGEPAGWKREWVVVAEVVATDATTAISSTSSGASVEIEASAAVGPGGLVDADAGLSIVSQQNIGVEMIAHRGATPLYKGRRIKAKWFWLWGVTVAPAASRPPTDLDAVDLFEDAIEEDDDDVLPPPAAN